MIVGGVASREGAEEGVGEETGNLVLAEGEGVLLLSLQEGDSVGDNSGQLQSQSYDLGEDGVEKGCGLKAVTHLTEVEMQTTKIPFMRITRIIH